MSYSVSAVRIRLRRERLALTCIMIIWVIRVVPRDPRRAFGFHFQYSISQLVCCYRPWRSCVSRPGVPNHVLLFECIDIRRNSMHGKPSRSLKFPSSLPTPLGSWRKHRSEPPRSRVGGTKPTMDEQRKGPSPVDLPPWIEGGYRGV